MSHIAPISLDVLTTLLAYRVVTLASTTAGTVTYPETNTALPIGITLDTVRDTTTGIPIAGPGNIARLFFNDTVAASGLVAADASGRGVPFTVGTQTTTGMTIQSCYVGRLVGAAVAATGTIADVLIMPGYARGTS